MASRVGPGCHRDINNPWAFPEQEPLGGLLCSPLPSWGVEDETGGKCSNSGKAARETHKLRLEGTGVPWQNVSKGEKNAGPPGCVGSKQTGDLSMAGKGKPGERRMMLSKENLVF